MHGCPPPPTLNIKNPEENPMGIAKLLFYPRDVMSREAMPTWERHGFLVNRLWDQMKAFHLLQHAPHFREGMFFLHFTLVSHSRDCFGHYHHHHHCGTCKTSQKPWSLYLVPKGGYSFPLFQSLASSPAWVINKVTAWSAAALPLFVTSSWVLSSSIWLETFTHPSLPFLS